LRAIDHAQRWCASDQEIAQRPCRSARIANRERQRAPASQSTEFDNRRRDGSKSHDIGWRAEHEWFACTRDHDHAICVLHDALEAMLGKNDGYAEIVHESLEGREDFLGCAGIECRRWLVEH
jgi:hypothetical protein